MLWGWVKEGKGTKLTDIQTESKTTPLPHPERKRYGGRVM